MAKLLYDYILIRYGELTTKGKNRKEFQKQFVKNLKARLSEFEGLEFDRQFDSVMVKLNGQDYEAIKDALKTVFGYSYFAGAIKVSKDIEEIKEACLLLANKKEYKTFKMACKRGDKNYPIHSADLNRIIATHILKNTDIKVDVHEPELMLRVLVKEDCAYIMDEKISGPGGYPVGSNGQVLLMMSGGIDSPVAGYLTMKRGLRIECIHFASMPYTSKQALDKVLLLAKKLSYYQEFVNVHVINFTDLQLAIYKYAEEPYAVTLMRRMMYRIADRICNNRNCLMISNGESIGQVASQTPESIKVIENVCENLVVRPVCMMDKFEIINLAKKIDTYETSILPFEDCCTIFDPKNPVTKPKLNRCEFYESKFDYESLIETCINTEEIIKVSYKDDKEDIF